MSAELTLAGPRPLRGTMRVPGDKGISHRALLVAALADGRTRPRGLAPGDDVAPHRRRARTARRGRQGRHRRERLHRAAAPASTACAKPTASSTAGTRARRCACSPAWSRVGRSSPCSPATSRCAPRPMARVAEPLRAMGASRRRPRRRRLAPLVDPRRRAAGMPHRAAGARAAGEVGGAPRRAPGRRAATEIVEPAPEPRPHRAHARRARRRRSNGSTTGTVRVHGRARRRRSSSTCPGDPSSAAFFVGRGVHHARLGAHDRGRRAEPDPARVRRRAAAHGRRHRGRDHGGALRRARRDIRVEAGPLHGHDDRTATRCPCIDEIPALAVAAAFADGVTESATRPSSGEGEQPHRHHAPGAHPARDRRSRRGPTGSRSGAARPRAALFKSHGDHRIAMAAAVAGQRDRRRDDRAGLAGGRGLVPRVRRRPRRASTGRAIA